MEDDWITLKEKECIDDGDNDMAFTVSFLPNTGNKYFLATTDDTVKLYDFETGQLLQTFEELYSQYCDCGKFIHPVEPLKSSSKLIIPQHAYFITRGVEMLKKSEHERIVVNQVMSNFIFSPKNKQTSTVSSGLNRLTTLSPLASLKLNLATFLSDSERTGRIEYSDSDWVRTRLELVILG
ncbi:10087_t:CDS:2 [Entrophospora sp. SA101]|nr:10087_t:CDS:2 [Entrophospora sp. SA101]